jgi:hypothetical protein
MVNPFDVLPVLAMATLIVFIPLLADPPARPAPQRKRVPPKGATVPLISLRASHRD